MKQRWFKKNSGFYLPIHPWGFVVTLFAFVFMVPVVLAIDRHSHSVTDELYSVFIYATCTAFWWKWIAEKTSI
ncbi:MAG: hypothetical protein ABIW38_08410 [Ferruginibacter sp.]